MKPPKKRTVLPPPNRRHRPEGFAIILTLLVLTMMVVLVIGFNAATRTEQMAARNYSYQEQANQMAMLAVNSAVAMLNTNVTNWSARTQPGRVFTDSGGLIELSSASSPVASGTSTNVNIWVNTNYFIAPTTDPAAFSVPLVEVIRGTNRIGGYAFWVDDDGTRLNLNAAATAARTNFLPTNARPLVLSRDLFPSIAANNWTSISNGFTALLDPASSTSTTNGWGYFFTPRQLCVISNVGLANYNTMMFRVGGGPPNWRPTNSYALGSNGVPAALDAPGDFLATYGAAGYAGSLSDLSNAIDTVAGKFFRGPNYAAYFGVANGLAGKYSNNVLRQIIANINDAKLPGTDAAFTGAGSPDMLTTNGGGTNPIVPSTVLALRPSLFLNEILVGVAVAPSGGLDNNPEVQVWMQAEIVDPYRTGQGIQYEIVYGLRSLEFEGYYQSGTNRIPFSNSALSTNGEVREGVVTALGTVSANQFHVPANAYGFEFQCGVLGTDPALPVNAGTNAVITNITVRPSYVVLRAANAPNTVRDWALFEDFPTNGFVFTGPIPTRPLIGFFSSGPAAVPDSLFTRSIEKNDPRVRRFGTNTLSTNFPAWTIVSAPTPRANNSSVNYNNGTGIPGVGNDLVGTLGSIYDHPSFSSNAANFVLTRSNWISAFDLSRIHTGLQWRTLQFRAQAQQESAAGHVPDWALLEAFTVTNASSSPTRAFKLNINALPYPAANSMAPTALATAGLSRAGASGSLLSGMTAANAPLAAIGTNNLGFPASAGFANPAAAMLVGSNIANMTFTTTWADRRQGNANYQTNMYTLPAEVLEVNGVSNFSTDEAANEARAQGVHAGVAVASQVFTVYAAGFANDRTGAEVAQARLRAQVARDQNSGLFRVIFLEPLIWP